MNHICTIYQISTTIDTNIEFDLSGKILALYWEIMWMWVKSILSYNSD